MDKNLSLLVLLLFLMQVSLSTLQAQDAKNRVIERATLPDRYLLMDNLLSGDEEAVDQDVEAASISDKQVIERISDIYEQHLQSIRAQVNEDPLAAEKHLTSALKGIRKLLEDYPDLPGDSRFNELYRTVYTEYKSFYGIEEAENQVNGEVFAVQREIYESEDDWLSDRYVLPDNITKPKTEVPLVQNEHVNRHLTYYTIKRPHVMQKWMQRSEKYFPMMREIFRDEGVPEELVHLSMIESGLNPMARSWASAVGMWQFIQATGSVYGLEVNWWMDERRDPEKATRAAAQHLKDLYEIWDDWYLAIANYNISPRGLKRAIRAGGGEEDYWSAYAHLPRETQGYIPGFIATTMINLNAEEFGFKTDFDSETYSYDVAEVDPLMPLDALADAAGITKDKLKEYNPELLRWATPPGSKYPLKLPAGSKNSFLAEYKEIPKDKRARGAVVHQVSSGETLGHIAQKYGTSVRAIYESNERLSSTIHPGQKIVVPLAPGSADKVAVSSPSNRPQKKATSARNRSSSSSDKSSKSSKVYYSVKSGDTIGHIAEWFDVRSSQIRAWNGTSNAIRLGERLVIYVPSDKQNYYRQVDGFSRSEKDQIENEQRSGKDIFKQYASGGDEETIRYRVKRNDTLIKIANAFGVSVQQIKKANDLGSSRIYEGQQLQINKIN